MFNIFIKVVRINLFSVCVCVYIYTHTYTHKCRTDSISFPGATKVLDITTQDQRGVPIEVIRVTVLKLHKI